MKAAALAVDAADLRDLPGSGTERFVVRIARNSFGWDGRGLLIASRDGLRFTARRAGFTGYLRPRDRLFVPSNRIASVLREADVIRLHVRGEAGDESANLEFSAGAAAAAASIVRFLPAAQTVELEKAPRPVAVAPRHSAALWVSGLAAIAVGVAASLLLLDETELTSSVPDLPRPPLAEAESIPGSELLISRSELRAAEERTAAMKRKFALELRDLMDGKVTQSDFALRLNRDLIPQWRQEQVDLSRRFDRISTRLSVPDLRERSADLWAQALALYSEGLQEQRPEKVLQAFERVGRAEALEAEAYDLVRRAEERAASEAAGQP